MNEKMKEVIEESNTTIENEKLISDFMGFEYDPEKDGFKIPSQNSITQELKFHSSWDWLMPVVEKIEGETDATFNIENDNCHIEGPFKLTVNGYTKFESVYKAVVEFIKWYNKTEEL